MHTYFLENDLATKTSNVSLSLLEILNSLLESIQIEKSENIHTTQAIWAVGVAPSSIFLLKKHLLLKEVANSSCHENQNCWTDDRNNSIQESCSYDIETTDVPSPWRK